jgi:hypothetical protein
MENKKCNKCELVKPVSEFYKDSNKNDGYATFCIKCKKESSKKSYENNKDKIKERVKIYRENNKETISKNDKIYKENNKDKIKEINKIYREENKDKIKEIYKKYYENNKDKIMENYFDNREDNLKYMRDWKKKNRERLSEYQNNYYKERKKNDPLFKLSINIRGLIRSSIKNKGLKKNSKTAIILGCSFEQFKTYLESKFEPWMNWDNYGKYNGTPNYGWDIDHITPSSSAINEEELLKLNHFSNLQPLCSYVNRDIKIDKVS